MREARNASDPAELILDFDQILIVIVSLCKGQEETQNEGFKLVSNEQHRIVDYLMGVVEESYNDALFQELRSLVQEMRDDLGLRGD